MVENCRSFGNTTKAFHLGPNEDAGVVETARPNTDVTEFVDNLSHRKAAGLGMSYYSFTGRFAKTNYTGFKGALINEDANFKPLQLWYGRRVSLPMRVQFTRLAIAGGLQKRTPSSVLLKDADRYLRMDMIAGGRDYLDPNPETEATIGQLRSGLTSLKIECARRGLHWLRVLRQIAFERSVAEALGIVLDFSKGNGGNVNVDGDTTNNRDSKDMQELFGGLLRG